MKQRLEDFINQQKEIIAELKLFVKDKSVPLDNRWDSFTLAGRLGLIFNHDYIAHFTGEVGAWVDDELLDGNHFQRHETISCETCLEYAVDENKPEEFIENLKEQWIDKFIYSFEFDW